MLRLLLIRHAEAVAQDKSCDHERPLTPRGCWDAARLGAFCQQSGLFPEYAFVSPARRALDTLRFLTGELRRPVPFETDELLYCASVFELCEVLERAPPGIETLLIVGHNPGLAEFANFLLDGNVPLPHFPAPCLALIRLSLEDWREVGARRGELVHFANFSSMPAGEWPS
ncbi:MAG TPA: histidine phosphatase family protein [Methylocella sp.]|nr:histidine phosphatase family protein [Methylocella sp.]